MIALYQLFKIILGIIISVFILTLLLFFSGAYSGLQEGVIKGKVMDVFRITAENVYYSGNPQNFTEFGKRDFELRFDNITYPGLVYSSRSGSPKIRLRVPTYFTPGQDVLISQQSMDMEWWRYNFIEVTPDLTIIFNTKWGSSSEMDAFITNLLNYFQDTTFFDPDIRFAVCDGNDFDENPETKSDFLRDLVNFPNRECTMPVSEFRRLVILDDRCDIGRDDNAICIEKPVNGVGAAYVRDSGPLYYLEDYPFSLVAMIIAGASVNEKEGIEGEKLYKYANEVFLKEMDLASRVMAEKSEIVWDVIKKRESDFPENVDILTCRDKHLLFSGQMTLLNGRIGALLQDLEDTGNMGLNHLNSFVADQNDAIATYQELLSYGCDYSV